MNKPTMPYEKGKKFWIEIEAKEDGDLMGSNILGLVLDKRDVEGFEVNQLIFNDSYFKSEFGNQMIDYLRNNGFLE